MAPQLGRWFKYAQAKLDAALRSSNAELDELEAEREAQLADRPWLASDAEAPTFDEAKARIEWEAEEQRRRAERDSAVADDAAAPAGGVSTPAGGEPAISSGTEAEAAQARLELDRRERESKERLAAIREELGVDPVDGAPEA